MVLYTQATIALHNYLRTTESLVYCPPGFIDGKMVLAIQSMVGGGKMTTYLVALSHWHVLVATGLYILYHTTVIIIRITFIIIIFI